MDFSRCSEELKLSSIVVEENGRKFTIQNRQKEFIRKVRVDGCLIDDERKRCDYLFEIGQKCHCVIYLELKGSDIKHAFNQLCATIGCLMDRHGQSEKEVEKICHIVASRVPRAGPEVQGLKLQMARRYSALLLVSTREVTINIERDPYRKAQSS